MGTISDVNAYALDPKLFKQAIEDMAVAADVGADIRDPASFASVVTETVQEWGLRMHEGEIACVSIQLRYSALARITNAGGVPAFRVNADAPGRCWIDDAVIKAAATAPLLDRDGPVAFDEIAFADAVLTYAETRGQA